MMCVRVVFFLNKICNPVEFNINNVKFCNIMFLIYCVILLIITESGLYSCRSLPIHDHYRHLSCSVIISWVFLYYYRYPILLCSSDLSIRTSSLFLYKFWHVLIYTHSPIHFFVWAFIYFYNTQLFQYFI